MPSPNSFQVVSFGLTANLSWSSLNNATGYLIYRDGKEHKRIFGTCFADFYLDLGKTYSYKIAACDISGLYGSFSKEIEITPIAGPALMISDFYLLRSESNGDGKISSGDTVSIRNFVKNVGSSKSTSNNVVWYAACTLSTLDPYIKIKTSSISGQLAMFLNMPDARDSTWFETIYYISPTCPPNHAFSIYFRLEDDDHNYLDTIYYMSY
jgi:hypothetical protein